MLHPSEDQSSFPTYTHSPTTSLLLSQTPSSQTPTIDNLRGVLLVITLLRTPALFNTPPGAFHKQTLVYGPPSTKHFTHKTTPSCTTTTPSSTNSSDLSRTAQSTQQNLPHHPPETWTSPTPYLNSVQKPSAAPQSLHPSLSYKATSQVRPLLVLLQATATALPTLVLT